MLWQNAQNLDWLAFQAPKTNIPSGLFIMVFLHEFLVAEVYEKVHGVYGLGHMLASLAGLR